MEPQLEPHNGFTPNRKPPCDWVKTQIDHAVKAILDAPENSDFKSEVVKAGQDESALKKIESG